MQILIVFIVAITEKIRKETVTDRNETSDGSESSGEDEDDM